MSTCSYLLPDVLEILEATNRRRLYGPSSHTALLQLQDVASQLGYKEMVPSTPDRAVSDLPGTSDESYLCRRCFTQLEKRAKMKSDLAKLEIDIEKKLQDTASTLGIQQSEYRLNIFSGIPA